MAEELLPRPGLGFCEAFEVYCSFSILNSQCTERHQTILLDGICEGWVCWIINSPRPILSSWWTSRSLHIHFALSGTWVCDKRDYFSWILSCSRESDYPSPIMLLGLWKSIWCISSISAVNTSQGIFLVALWDCLACFASEDSEVLRTDGSSFILPHLGRSSDPCLSVPNCHQTKPTNPFLIFRGVWWMDGCMQCKSFVPGFLSCAGVLGFAW